jgi:ribosomal protein S18 acetylase RimI-like enzyme
MITKQKQLWMQAFGDSPESVDAFFRAAYEPSRSVVICRDDQLVSALYWLDYDWNGKKLAYIYAVATEESFRGQGYGRQLMKKAHKVLEEQGYAGAILVPAEEHLVRWYENQGYRTFFQAKKQELAPGAAVPVTEISAEQYAALRRARLPNAPQPGNEVYRYFTTYGSFYRAEDCLFAAAVQDERVYFQEFLGDLQKLPQIISGLNAKNGTAFVADQSTPFAMYYPLTESEMPDYFSFALD